MPKFTSPTQRLNFPGKSIVLLTIMPVFATAYLFLVLPFIPTVEMSGRRTYCFGRTDIDACFINSEKIDYRFFRSLPKASLIAYSVFAAASVTWAYSPEFAFGRLVVRLDLEILSFARLRIARIG